MVISQSYACDSTLLIDYLNGISEARFTVRRLLEPVISRITWIEVLAGAKAAQQNVALELLEQFEVLELSPEIAQEAVHLRQNLRLKLPDTIILATARVTGRLLITRNTKDFQGMDNVHFPCTLRTQ